MAGYPGISIRKLDPGTYQLSQQYAEKLREFGGVHTGVEKTSAGHDSDL
jgi:hypothetical protein